MHAQDMVARVLAAVHEAALDDALWPAASALLDEAVGTVGNALLVGEGPEDDVRILFGVGCFRGRRHHEMEREYFHDYHPWDERAPRFRRLPAGKVVHVTDLYSDAELRTSRTYNEFASRYNGRNGLAVRLDGPLGTHITWAINDPVRGGSWHAGQLTLIRRLLPHIRQFVRVRQAIADAHVLRGSFAALFHNTHVGVVYLDRHGRVVEVNDRALDVLRRRDGLVDRDGRLSAWLPADNETLQRHLHAAIPPFGAHGVGRSMTVGRAADLPRLVLHIHPVAGGRSLVGMPRVAALVLLVQPESRPRLDAGLVSQALGLTPAESEVAVMLAEGRTIRDIAAATGRKPGTVYDLLKLAYKRRGISRQVDLVRMVLRLAVLPASKD